MTHFAELDGIRVVDARVCFPRWGAWHADVTIEKDATVGAKSTLVFGDLTLACAAWRPPVAWQGRTRVRLIGGAGGWGNEIDPFSYSSPNGVKLALVLGDAAKAAGERVELLGSLRDKSVGSHYQRVKAVASRVLNLFVPGAWWIAPNGKTMVSEERDNVSAIGSSFSIERVDGARGLVVVATEKPGDFMPGRTFKGSTLTATTKIGGVTHILTGEKLRTEVLAA